MGAFPVFVWFMPRQVRSLVFRRESADVSLWGLIVPVTNHHQLLTLVKETSEAE